MLSVLNPTNLFIVVLVVLGSLVGAAVMGWIVLLIASVVFSVV